MADLASIIARKETNDTEWRAGRQAERDNVYALQDTAVSYIVSQPDAYARYLDAEAILQRICLPAPGLGDRKGVLRKGRFRFQIVRKGTGRSSRNPKGRCGTEV